MITTLVLASPLSSDKSFSSNGRLDLQIWQMQSAQQRVIITWLTTHSYVPYLLWLLFLWRPLWALLTRFLGGERGHWEWATLSDVDESLLFSLTGQYKERAQLEDRMLVKDTEEGIQKNELKEEKEEAWHPQRGTKQLSIVMKTVQGFRI